MKDVIVVGCGIMGATIALALRKQGRDVLILDGDKPKCGTNPSGGHIKPSWSGGMSKQDYDTAFETLSGIWDVKEETFKVTVGGVKIVNTSIWRVDTAVVVKTPRCVATVEGIGLLHSNAPEVVFRKDDVLLTERCRLLVIAAGVWCADLLPSVFPPGSLKAKQGVSFRFPGQVEPFIRPWAPYKQVVAHQQGPDEIWVGDGSAIKPENWDAHMTSQRALTRCRNALGTKSLPKRTIIGLRPYCSLGDGPCYLNRVSKSLWVATGAGKLGTIAAGWAAHRIVNDA